MEIKPGDIIIAHNYGLFGLYVRIMTRSYWNHCCLYLGNDEVLDILARGVKKLSYNKYYKDKIEHKIIRVSGLSDLQREIICRYALNFIDKQFNFWIMFGIKGDHNHMACSEIIHRIFEDTGIFLTRGLKIISPADINCSPMTYTIAVYPKGGK